MYLLALKYIGIQIVEDVVSEDVCKKGLLLFVSDCVCYFCANCVRRDKFQ